MLEARFMTTTLSFSAATASCLQVPNRFHQQFRCSQQERAGPLLLASVTILPGQVRNTAPMGRNSVTDQTATSSYTGQVS
jgi:hypothetical protein